ncbi:hypothetical protein [Pseudoxanthomonas sacheonensis]|uniref:hypothetical protein n=1 Tax=Pseudoxanthomonas sacheonensis TaxID=443615 RepID=UPI0013D1B554|nr:hypothetical protein [Pseudoxanthomonas sacheonensis]KAF1708413.1 hypothetical protein CSC73_09035 [Pseudoxanthomonas sacheonensis]
MTTTAANQRRIDWKQAVYGGLLIAMGDALFAIAVWFEWNAKGLTRMFQSIAMGVLGKASYEGGTATALLGAGLHVGMAIAFVAICVALGFRFRLLVEKPVAAGLLYGMGLYVVMNFVVMPLSRVGASPSFKHLDTIAMSVVAHMVFGVVCTLFARRARRMARAHSG